MRHRRLVLTLIFVPLVAIGGWSLVWLLAARQVQAVFQDWVAARRAAGWQISDGPERLTGWPSSAAVKIRGFSISGGGNLLPGGLSWRSQRLVLRLPLSSPRHLFVVPGGTQHLGLFGGPELMLTASHFMATVPIALLPFMTGAGAPPSLVASAEELKIGPAGLDPTLVTARTLKIEAAPGATPGSGALPGASLRAQAAGVTVGHGKVTSLGPEIGVFSFSGALIGRMPAGPDWASRLGAWRDRGGMVAVRSLSLVWGPLAVGATGRLVLDQKLQPAGEGTARVVGYAATLDALASAGRIGSGVATAAKALLTLLARPSSAGGPPEVDVPLSLENRTLEVGHIPLIKLPSVTWAPGP